MESRLGCPAGTTTYLWATGDTLMGVALRHGVSEQAIRNANPDKDFNNIGMGAIVCIPNRPLACPNGTLHMVRPGETINSIANAYGISAREIMDRNPYVDPSNLVTGEYLCIPTVYVPPIIPVPVPTPTPAPMPTPIPTPTPPPAPVQRCPSGYEPGTVAYGQTIGDILLRNNVSYLAFRLSNPNLNPERLIPGQRYCIPPTGSRGLCATGGRSYVMERADTLANVAQRFGTTPEQLLRLNQNLAPGDFVPGRVICIG